MRQKNNYNNARNYEGYADPTFYKACGKEANKTRWYTTDELKALIKDGHTVEWRNKHWVIDGND